MMPVQNTGAENPSSAKMVTPWLSRPFGRRAAITPRTVPTITARICALSTSSKVAGSRSSSSSVTGRLKKNECPRSNRASLAT